MRDQVPTGLSTKTRFGVEGRFTTLDGYRGVAAILVVWYHMGVQHWLPPLPYGYLAVDLFFILSGFVLAQVNDPRFARGQSVRQFIQARIIRLWPLYIVGFVIGAIDLVRFTSTGVGKGYVALELVTNGLLLPMPSVHKASGLMFPVDEPAWSLFYELYAVNFMYAVGWRLLKGAALAVLVIFAGAVVGVAALRYHGLDFGWSIATIPAGIARATLSFFVGVSLSRLRRVRSVPHSVPAWLLLSTVVSILVIRPPTSLVVPFELACLFAVFPALVYLGAGAPSTNPRLGYHLGEISYATYAIHVPVIWLLYHLFGAPRGIVEALAIVAMIVGAAAVLDRYYDTPVRRFLTRHSVQRRVAPISQP